MAQKTYLGERDDVEATYASLRRPSPYSVETTTVALEPERHGSQYVAGHTVVIEPLVSLGTSAVDIDET